MYNVYMAELNEILKNNLSYINIYDAELCRRIESVDELSMPIEMTYTAQNEPNLSVAGFPISDYSGAQQEAQRLVDSLSHNCRASVHVLFGLGFGYIFKQLVQFSSGTVILYEPCLELLRVALEMVDFSEDLSQGRVFVTDNLDMLEKHFVASYRPGTRTSLLFTKYHKSQLVIQMNKLLEKLGVLQGMMEVDSRQRAEIGGSYVGMLAANLFELQKYPYIGQFENALLNVPAIIAAAGPSLSENIAAIKKYRNKAVLFTVSTALGVLHANDITPDFVSMVELFNAVNLVQNFGIEQTCLIAEPYVNTAVLRLPFKNKIITSSQENRANEIYDKAFDIDKVYFESKGTVAYNALFAAKFMGCNPIILVGQDLAYVDGNCYSKDSPLADYKCKKTASGWEVWIDDKNRLKENLYGHYAYMSEERKDAAIDARLKELNTFIMTAKTLEGKEVATSSAFALFAEYYKNFAKKYSQNIKLYTTTKKGAYLGEFQYKELEEILKDFEDCNASEVVKKIHDSTSDNKWSIEFLRDEYKILARAYNLVGLEVETFKQFSEELQSKKLSERILRMTKELLKVYLKIQDECMKFSLFYRETTYASRYYIGKIIPGLNTLTVESVCQLRDALEIFYVKDYERIGNLMKSIDIILNRIEDESCSTKS